MLKQLPSYEHIFGEIDFKKSDEARSVYSPAAYLADLLQLLDDEFDEHTLSFDQRRSDIKALLLDAKNTFDMLPYLDRVNEVVASKIKNDSVSNEEAFTQIRKAVYPFNLPQDLDYESIKVYLNHLSVQAEALYKLLEEMPEPELLAKAYLKTFEAQWDRLIETSRTGDELAKCYGVTQLAELKDEHHEILVDQFIKATEITALELREILFQNLNDDVEKKSAAHLTRFFCNSPTKGYAFLSEDEEKIKWQSIGTTSVQEGLDFWLDRVHRFIRLANKVELSFTELDLILRNCCNNTLDAEAFVAIAIVHWFKKKLELGVDQICAFVNVMNNLGHGNEEMPADLFNRVYNGTCAIADQHYIGNAVTIPKQFTDQNLDLSRLTFEGDILDFRNDSYRKRVAHALDLPVKQLTYLVKKFRLHFDNEQYWSHGTEAEVQMLTTFYRVSQLVKLCEVTLEDLFVLFDILQKDPAVRHFKNCHLLIDLKIEERDCYTIVSNNNTRDTLWLTQVVYGLCQWMQKNDFATHELLKITSGGYVEKIELNEIDDTMPVKQVKTTQEMDDEAKLELFKRWQQAFKPYCFKEDSLEKAGLDRRFSRLAFETIRQEQYHLTEKDSRVLCFDARQAEKAAAHALDKIDTITEEDFRGLGISEKFSDKIYNNLIYKGYLDTKGRLVKEQLPKEPIDFEISCDFSDIQEPLFRKIQELHEDYHDISIYPSDLEAFELGEVKTDELYNNLIFNGYLDAQGALIEKEFFTDDSRLGEFEVNTNITEYVEEAVFGVLSERNQAVELHPVVVNQSTFSNLPLTEQEIDDLLENLQFNEYLNEEKTITDNFMLIDLALEDFFLELQFYPHRAAILSALQAHIEKSLSQYLIFTRDDFEAAADMMTADWCYLAVEANFLEDRKIIEEHKSYFRDEKNAKNFDIWWAFSPSNNEVIFNEIRNIVISSDQFQFTENLLDDYNFDAVQKEELFELLDEIGYITAERKIPDDRLAYFLNIENALIFTLDDFEDYNKDVFFLLHAIAKKQSELINQVVAQLKQLAMDQEKTIYKQLQEKFNLNVDSLKVISEEVFKGSDHVAVEWLLPLLESEDLLGNITELPQDRPFNNAYFRTQQFAILANKLKLTTEDIKLVFLDQNLTKKFPEKLSLPSQPTPVNTLDSLLEHTDGSIYLFRGDRYWVYDRETYEIKEEEGIKWEEGKPLKELSPHFVSKVIDAAFVDMDNNNIIITDGKYYQYSEETELWELQTEKRKWGTSDHNFLDLDKIDAAYTDRSGYTYLFSRDEYVRQSQGSSFIDEGYPKSIAEWRNEPGNDTLPLDFQESIDAAFVGLDGETYLFKDKWFTSSEDPGSYKSILEKWGRSQNNLKTTGRVNASYTEDSRVMLFSGDQILSFSDCLENEAVTPDEGFPKLIKDYFTGLPAAFQQDLDAAFRDQSKTLYLFKEDEYITIDAGHQKSSGPLKIKQDWGKAVNPLAEGTVDAVCVGLDGKTYVFSGSQYFCYSTEDYTQVDSGYPRLIAADWGGLSQVDAAFVLDGKTYLFGSLEGKPNYIRYSTNDYRKMDKNYPRAVDNNWWNLPESLVQTGFAKVDAVFNDLAGRNYLFCGNQFVYSDSMNRWWSEPQKITEKWDSIPFTSLDAAFTGKDGKTYFFSGKDYVRFSDRDYCHIDGGYPRKTGSFWGKIKNNIQQGERIDAAVTLTSNWKEKDAADRTIKKTARHTYLFCGDQFFRYTGDQYENLEQGYPKLIQESLADEPRFIQLREDKMSLAMALNPTAAFADQHNVYLFDEHRFRVISEQKGRTYENFTTPDKTIRCAFVDQGTVYVEDETAGWEQISSLEGENLERKAGAPDWLMNLDNGFNIQPDAVLHGTDGNRYLFKGNKVYNLLLDKKTNISQEWGRPFNCVYESGKIDAVLLGRDGNCYLFSHEQFLTYKEGRQPLDGFASELPQSIEEKWGGLKRVAHAYTLRDKTYLLEPANEQGEFRYVCYSSNDYTTPDQGYPKFADHSFWNIPQEYQAEGFESVDTVFVEQDRLILIHNGKFLEYNSKQDYWAYPKSLDRLWKGITCDNHVVEELQTVFVDQTGEIYCFNNECFISITVKADDPDTYVLSEPRRIRYHWGLVASILTDKVDAAVVDQHGTTYLFAGDQYVRYSTRDYRYIDPEYPKSIAVNLRKEESFKNLPDDFERKIAEAAAAKAADSSQTGLFVQVAVVNQRNLYVVVGNSLFVASTEQAANYESSALHGGGAIFSSQSNIDAAATWIDPADATRKYTYLFSGRHYIRYSDETYKYIDNGYPKTITSGLPDEPFATSGILSGVLKQFHEGINAALEDSDGVLHLIKGDLDWNSQTNTTSKITALWGKIQNNFRDSEAIDAAFIDREGGLVVFKGNQYIRYADPLQEYIDPGYPKVIQHNWGNLPGEFETRIDAAFRFEDHVYLVKGDQYVRFINASDECPRVMGPYQFSLRWGQWADYLIADIKTITQFKKLRDTYTNGDTNLTEVLHPKSGNTELPYLALADIFDWDINQIKWLKKNNHLDRVHNQFENRFDIESMLWMFDCFNLAHKISTEPKELYEKILDVLLVKKKDFTTGKRYPDPTQFQQVKAELSKLLSHSNCGVEGVELLHNEIRDELNLLKRDALLPYAISQDDDVENDRDLYEKLLIDVKMSSCASTSKIKEALAAVQLFMHRYFINLEEAKLKDADQEQRRKELLERWRWMKNYRVWEANRKVFLYPENYIRAELRDTKTPEFQKLEQTLVQGELTKVNVTQAFNQFIDAYTELSQLKVAGGYMYDDPKNEEDKNLVLFSYTKSEPRQYYYRTATFLEGKTDSVVWKPWEEVTIQINSNRVYPVFTLDRIYVFWAEIEQRSSVGADTGVSINSTDDDTKVESNAVFESVLQIYYSYYSLNKTWAPAQKLNYQITSNDTIDNYFLSFSGAEKTKETDLDRIRINCNYITERQIKPKFNADGVAEADVLINAIRRASEDGGSRVYLKAVNTEGLHLFNYDDRNEGGSTDLYAYVERILPGDPFDRVENRFEVSVSKLPNQNDFVSFKASDPSRSNYYLADQNHRLKLKPESGGEFIYDASFRIVKGLLGDGYTLETVNMYSYLNSLSNNEDTFKGLADKNLLYFNDHGQVRTHDRASFQSQQDKQRATFKILTDRSEEVSSFYFYPETRVVVDRGSDSNVSGNSSGIKTFQSLFPNEAVEKLELPVLLHTPENKASLSWVCFDYKGGSFLCKPSSSVPDPVVGQITNQGGSDFNIDAAFTADNSLYLFSKQGEAAKTSIPQALSTLTIPASRPTAQEWGKVNNKIQQDNRVDAACVIEGKTYLFRDDQYVRYSNGYNGPVDDGYPLQLTANNSFTGFSKVDAAFRFGQHSYFINGGEYTRSDDLNTKRSLQELWAASRPVLPTQGLQIHYPFYGNANNASSNNHHGTVHGATLTTGHQGEANHAYQFDGVDDYIDIPSTNPSYAQGFSVQAWVYYSSFKSWSRIMDFGNGAGNSNIIFANETTTQNLVLAIYKGGKAYQIAANNILEANQWMHLAATVDNDGNAKLYKNGMLVAEKMLTKASKVSRKNSYIGRSNWSADGYFHGKISDWAIYNRELSADEVSQLARSTASAFIDYALVKDDKLYLVRGQEYNRYGNADDLSQPDTGYPKLLSEAGTDPVSNETGINAGFAAAGKQYFFKDNQYFAADNPTAKADIKAAWAIVKNNIASTGKVDAAFTHAGKTYLFSGDQYYRYSGTQFDFVEYGYPKLLHGNAAGLPQWSGGVRAAFTLNNQVFLFTNHQYAVFDHDTARSEIKNIKGNWQWPKGFSNFDAAFQFQSNQEVYLITDSQYTSVSTFLSAENTKYDVIRLSSMTGSKLSQALFARGIDHLFALKNQEIDELPIFTKEPIEGDSIVQVNQARVDILPLHSHLEFRGANGLYYWELFFHAPLLIAQSLNTQQKFEEAKKWFETIFNPTNEFEYWEFLPFLAVDIKALILRLETYSAALSLTVTPVIDLLKPYTEAFEGQGELTAEERQNLRQLPEAPAFVQFKAQVEITQASNPTEAGRSLAETLEVIARLPVRYGYMVPDADESNPQIKAYLEDPFDPHAIARLRRIAYRRTTVMGYIDNLIDWGDQLFRQYTRESINEARMHYILAYDLLGRKPESTGDRVLSDALPYRATDDHGSVIGIGTKGAEFDSSQYDFLFDVSSDSIEKTSLTFAAKTHSSVGNAYFYLPENQNLIDYWDRIEDRLYKIRHCLNIMGIKQPLPLFQPPIDPMALVRAVAGGGGMGGALAGLSVPIPHYRFTFMLNKARELVGKLSQFGGDLLAAIEKKDSEALSLLQNRQEKEILEITAQIREAQLNEALENLKSLEINKRSAEQQKEHYHNLIEEGLIAPEHAQIVMMGIAVGMHVVSAVLKTVSAIVSASVPDVNIGPPFATSVGTGGGNIGQGLETASEVVSSAAEAVSMGGEIAGIYAQHQRSVEDWKLQEMMAENEIAQLERQIEGAKYQIQAARLEVSSTDREIKHNESIKQFMTGKFSNEQLYQWMSSKLSALFFQSYNLAHDMAKAAEKSYHFERGVEASETSFIGGMYWDSLRKGLLSGDSLGHDLDRMEKAYIDSNVRTLEIGKHISLAELDPMAFIQLQSKGSCEFHLSEALFDYDFQGHYHRQVKTIALAINAGEGKTVNATLTQLRNKMVMKPDLKAVKFLLNPQGQEPLSIRSDWRTSQQIALGDLGEYDEPNGLFELRLDDDRYLPFEGTGAVSSWRLELSGKRGSYQLNEIKQVMIKLKYTALNAGATFASGVKGALKPYPTAVHFNFQEMFANDWYSFIDDDTEELEIKVTRDMLPNLSGSKVTGLVPHYDLQGEGAVSLTINDDSDLTLKQGQFNPANGLLIPGSGATWTFSAKGDKSSLRNLGLVVMYKAKV